MERDTNNDTFVKFPYRREIRDDGEINNGGINLIKEPHRINEIHEVKDAPWFKLLLIEVNAESGLFMTLGCAYGPLDEYFAGYLDFSFRPTVEPMRRIAIRDIDISFYDYLADEETKHDILDGSMVSYAQSCLSWSYSPLQLEGREIYDKVSVWFHCQDESACEWLVDHLRHFLVEAYPSLPQ